MPVDRCVVCPKLLNDKSNRMLARLVDIVPEATGFKDRMMGKLGHRLFDLAKIGIWHFDNGKNGDWVVQWRFPFSGEHGSYPMRVRQS